MIVSAFDILLLTSLDQLLFTLRILLTSLNPNLSFPSVFFQARTRQPEAKQVIRVEEDGPMPAHPVAPKSKLSSPLPTHPNSRHSKPANPKSNRLKLPNPTYADSPTKPANPKSKPNPVTASPNSPNPGLPAKPKKTVTYKL